MSDSSGEGKRRFWQWLTIVGFVASVCFGLVSYLNAPAASILRPGRPLPDVVVTTYEGRESTLEAEAAGYSQVLIVTPSCDKCDDQMIELVASAEAEAGGMEKGLEKVLILVIRTDLMPRAGFMPAFQRARQLGAYAVIISLEEAPKLGISELPVVVELGAEGLIVSVSYPRDQR